MDYFTIIKRLGLFQDNPKKDQRKNQFPPVHTTRTYKSSLSVGIPSPIMSSPSARSPQNTIPDKIVMQIAQERSNSLRLITQNKVYDSEKPKKPSLKYVINSGSKKAKQPVPYKPPLNLNKYTESRGLSGWSRSSSIAK